VFDSRADVVSVNCIWRPGWAVFWSEMRKDFGAWWSKGCLIVIECPVIFLYVESCGQVLEGRRRFKVMMAWRVNLSQRCSGNEG